MFRPATMDDAEILLAWRNDPVTCSQSLNTEPVPHTVHIEWLARSILYPNRKLLIAVLDNEPVGTVRFDTSGAGCELSWTVAPQWRGRGVGTRMVTEATRIAIPLFARVKIGNVAAQKIASRAGFGLISEDGAIQTWRRGIVHETGGAAECVGLGSVDKE